MIDTTDRWQHLVLTETFAAEGCCFADMDGDGVDELVAGAHWWKVDGSDGVPFRTVPDAWLPPWGGGPDRHDPHAHLREGGGPAQYKAATYDWALTGTPGRPTPVLSVGMHRDPVRWYEPGAAPGQWSDHEVVRGGIYESAVYAELDDTGTYGLVTVPDRPQVAWYEPGPDPRQPWTEHLIGELGGNWHGLGVGALEQDGPPHVLTPTGFYRSGEDIRQPWHWSAFTQIDSAGNGQDGLGDVCLIHAHAVGGGTPSLFGASPHDRGLWRWDLVAATATGRTYRRYDLETSTSQLHALRVLPALPGEDVDAWVITGKRWQAHGAHHDTDPAGDPVLFRVGVYADPDVPSRVELIGRGSGVGLQFAARRLPDGRMQIATANKLGVHMYTEREDTSS